MIFVVVCLVLSAFYGHIADATVVQSNNAVSPRIYNLLRANRDVNLICSPFSISTAGSLGLVGARGQTALEIKRGLEYSNLTQAQINQQYRALLPSFNAAGLIITNAVFVASDTTILSSYRLTVQRDYHSRVPVFHSYPVEEINAWVRNATRGLIPTAVRYLRDDTSIILIDVNFFRGSWVHPFRTQDTKNAVFFTRDGSPAARLIPQMHQVNIFPYVNSRALDAQVLRMDFRGTGESMFIILPHARSGLEGIESRLSISALSTAFSQMNMTRVNVTIPKFRFENTFDLLPTVRSLGIVTALGNNADFGNMTPRKVNISDFRQKSLFDVNESGVAVASGSAISFTPTSVLPRTVNFIANHPFLFIIRHNPSGSLVFWGRFVRPTEVACFSDVACV